MIRIVVSLLLVAACSQLVACNTVRGVGQDIEKAGDAIQRSTH